MSAPAAPRRGRGAVRPDPLDAAAAEAVLAPEPAARVAAALVRAGGAGPDRLSGGARADTLNGRAGNDILSGGGGNDRLIGGPGDDLLTGGSGQDTASYAGLRGGVTVSLAVSGPQRTGAGGIDTLRGVERLEGGAGRDRLTGNAGANRLDGGAGADTLSGGAGRDTLAGGAGNDLLTGGAGADVLVFAVGQGADRVRGFAAAADLIDLTAFGGASFTLADGPGGAILTLTRGAAKTTVVIAGASAEAVADRLRLFGGDAADTLSGGAGDQILFGGGGADTLGTSAGRDTLVGGQGADLYAVRRAEGAPGAVDAEPDVARGFDYFGGDRIGLVELLDDLAFDALSDVVETAQSGGDTVILVRRDGALRPVLTLEDRLFTLDQLKFYGIEAPDRDAATFVANPYGFTNLSASTADPAITPDGRWVAFVDKQNLDGNAEDLTPSTAGDEGDASMDVFLRNVRTGETLRVSATPDGAALRTGAGDLAQAMAPSVSANGRFVAFATNAAIDPSDSGATGDVYLRDMFRADSPLVLVSAAADGSAGGGVPVGDPFGTESQAVLAISANGRKVAFVTTSNLLAAGDGPQDANGELDVYLRDLGAGTTTLVSAVDNAADPLDGDAGGRLVAALGGTRLYDKATVAMSGDGRYVAFATRARLVAEDVDADLDVYLRDVAGGETLLVSGGAAGDAFAPALSDSGARLAFQTDAALDPDDTNDFFDVYLADIDLAAFRLDGRRRVSEAEDGREGDDGDSYNPTLSPGGERLAFFTASRNLAPDLAPGPSGINALIVAELATGRLAAPPAPYADNPAGNSEPPSYALTDDGIAWRVASGSGGGGGRTGESIAVDLIDFGAPL